MKIVILLACFAFVFAEENKLNDGSVAVVAEDQIVAPYKYPGVAGKLNSDSGDYTDLRIRRSNGDHEIQESRRRKYRGYGYGNMGYSSYGRYRRSSDDQEIQESRRRKYRGQGYGYMGYSEGRYRRSSDDQELEESRRRRYCGYGSMGYSQGRYRRSSFDQDMEESRRRKYCGYGYGGY